MSLTKFFKKRKVAMLPELEDFLGVSPRTVLRRLELLGYYSSYNHNSSYYTLKSIPKFDRNLIWIHRTVGFTKLNNLFDLIVHCVDRSLDGYSAEELSAVVHTRVANQLRTLFRGGRVRRARFSEGYLYFSLDPTRYRRQMLRRGKATGQEPISEPETVVSTLLPAGLTHEEIVAVLTVMINEPKYSIRKLKTNLDKQGLDVSEAALQELVEVYELKRYKKKEHRLLPILLAHLASATGQPRSSLRNKITFLPHQRTCPEPDCEAPLRTYKTQNQKVYSVWYGNFAAKVRYLYCDDHPYSSEEHLKIQSYRSEVLAKIVGRSRRYAYDVMCYIGISRFLQARQIREIRAELKRDYDIPISEAHASRLSDEFLIRLSCLHASYTRHLKRLIQSKGGYYLHLDASSETKSSTVFVGLDSVTGWILISEKIPSEREEFIVPVLKQLRRLFGRPQGIMRDMARAVENAVATVFPEVPERICHFHLLKDVGKDILADDYKAIRSLMIREKVTAQLNSLRRDLLVPLKSHHPDTRIIQQLLDGTRKWTRQVYRSIDLVVLVSTVDWIMNYGHDGSGLGFPFDHSYVYFYQRCWRAHDCLLRLKKRVSSRQFKDARLDTLVFALARVCDQAYESASALKQMTTTYAAKLSEFNKLRRVMRFYCDPKAPLSQPLGYGSLDEMRAANKELKKYLRDAKRRLRTTREHARREALGVLVQHIERHWDYLVVNIEPGAILGPRTNNDQEGAYRDIKKKIRRVTGKKDISREFDRLGAYMPLVQNLDNPSYVCEVIGSLDNLPEAFADLPPELVKKHTEQFYEARYGVGYQLRRSINPIELLDTLKSRR